MQYIYEIVKNDDTAHIMDVCTRFEDLENEFEKRFCFPDFYIRVYKGSTKSTSIGTIMNKSTLEAYRLKLEREVVWPKKSSIEKVETLPTHNKSFVEDDGFHYDAKSPPQKDAINPPHYQSYIDEYQWIEAMCRMQRFRDPERFKAAIELQIRKYLDRNGGKDSELQELEKALWYLKFLVAYIKNQNRPVFVSDIEAILKQK